MAEQLWLHERHLPPLVQRSSERSKERCQVPPDHPLRVIPAYIGDRWSVPILLALRGESLRFCVLQRRVSRISYEGKIAHRILTSKLRALERDGFVLRHEVPHSRGVEYALTPLGHGLLEQVNRLTDWIGAHIDRINESRARNQSAATPPGQLRKASEGASAST